MNQDSDSKDQLSRRHLLQAAGGVTFLALVPRLVSAENGSPVYELPRSGQGKGRPPVFTALPYLQPGASGSKLQEGTEAIVIAWQTDDTKAEFGLSYGERSPNSMAEIKNVSRQAYGKDDGESRINYTAFLTGLKLNTKYRYRVTLNGSTFMEGFFTTRKPRGVKCRFVAFGDNSYGDVSDRAIAFQAFRAMPDFVMNSGDNVYDDGLDDEYARFFFPVYNSDQAGPRVGAPLLRAVPFYTVMANHDVHVKDANKHPVADFTKNPDSLGYFTNMHLPLNGPSPTHPTPAVGNAEAIEGFKAVAGDRFPRMANYSFDYADAHFLCLDANVYIDPTDPALQSWIEEDLAGTDATWKFSVYHHPAFNVGNEHYHEQHMRVLAPIFEKHGVTIVFNGHEHLYQRNQPLRFTPTDLKGAKQINKTDRYVPGDFKIDQSFDGVSNKRPDGVIYITTGAGGKHLYDPEMNQNPESWVHAQDNNVKYVAKLISDRHSITVIDMTPKSLDIRQIDQWGEEIDHFRIEAKG